MSRGKEFPEGFPLPVCEACSDNLQALLQAGSGQEKPGPGKDLAPEGGPSPDGPGAALSGPEEEQG